MTWLIFNRDILQLIAEQISDKASWYYFALVNKAAASIVRRLTEQKKREFNPHHYWFETLTDDELIQFDPNMYDQFSWTGAVGGQLIDTIRIEWTSWDRQDRQVQFEIGESVDDA